MGKDREDKREFRKELGSIRGKDERGFCKVRLKVDRWERGGVRNGE